MTINLTPLYAFTLLLSFTFTPYAEAKGTQCLPPSNLVKSSLQKEAVPGLETEILAGEIGGVKGAWTVVSVDHTYQIPATKTAQERKDLIQKLTNERMATDFLLGRDNHVIHEMDLFANGIEAYGSYLDKDADSHYYLNWEFGLGKETCILEFESNEIITPDAKTLKEIRYFLSQNN
jgi:hypothetical protein